jgi:mono/diheme cytochrome c family protein
MRNKYHQDTKTLRNTKTLIAGLRIRRNLTFLAPALVLALTAAVLAQTVSNSATQTGDRERGSAQFEAQCASCHERDGRGTEGGPPPLQGSPWVSGPETRLIKIVLHGMRGKVEVNGKTYNLEMPGFGKVLTDEDIAAVVSFVRGSWGGRTEPIAPAEVRRVRDATRNRTDYWTVDELLLDQ